ncbi:hypothetical protein PO909_020761 [Leuciscus waleckii]
MAHIRCLGLRLNTKKECVDALPEDYVPGSCMGFHDDAGTNVSRARGVHTGDGLQSEARPQPHCEAVSETAGPHGSSVQRHTFWPATHETPTVVVESQGVFPEGKSVPYDQGNAQMPSFPCHMEETLVPVPGTGAGSIMLPENRFNRCLPHWLGRGHGRPLCERPVGDPAFFLAHHCLKCFFPDLRGHYVLIRSDNTSVVAYLNHQGGLRSRPLCRLAHQILLWSQGKLSSLRAMYVPRDQNQGADVLSRQGLRPGEWRLHPEVVEAMCVRFGPVEVDLFASQETSHCPLWFSLRNVSASSSPYPAPRRGARRCRSVLSAMENHPECYNELVQAPVPKRAKANQQASNRQSTLAWKTETDVDMPMARAVCLVARRDRFVALRSSEKASSSIVPPHSNPSRGQPGMPVTPPWCAVQHQPDLKLGKLYPRGPSLFYMVCGEGRFLQRRCRPRRETRSYQSALRDHARKRVDLVSEQAKGTDLSLAHQPNPFRSPTMGMRVRTESSQDEHEAF